VEERWLGRTVTLPRSALVVYERLA